MIRLKNPDGSYDIQRTSKMSSSKGYWGPLRWGRG